MIANKEDLVNTETKKISDEEVRESIKELDGLFLSTSSKTGKGLDEFLVNLYLKSQEQLKHYSFQLIYNKTKKVKKHLGCS